MLLDNELTMTLIGTSVPSLTNAKDFLRLASVGVITDMIILCGIRARIFIITHFHASLYIVNVTISLD
jgi:hypothetical protein